MDLGSVVENVRADRGAGNQELVLLADAGLSPLEALRAATLNPAVIANASSAGQTSTGCWRASGPDPISDSTIFSAAG